MKKLIEIFIILVFSLCALTAQAASGIDISVPSVGESCSDTSDCTGNEECVADVCVCTVDSDCAVGEECVASECVEIPPDCTVDDDCAVGEECVAGECVEIPPDCTVDGDCAVGEECVAGECVEIPPEVPVCTLEEALDLPDVVWETGGASNWFCQDKKWVVGGTAAQSDMLCDEGTIWLQTTVTVDEGKHLSFQWKIWERPNEESQPDEPDGEQKPPCPSCPSESYLRFLIDGEQQGTLRPNSNWLEKMIVCLTPGTHTLRWELTREEGPDCPNSIELEEPGCEPCLCHVAWVDNVEIIDPPSVSLIKHYVGTYPQSCPVDPQFAKNRVAKAEPDEDYEGDPKTNQAYVWSLTRTGMPGNLWFGTVANTPCWVGGIMSAGLGLGGSLPAIETQNLMCEFGDAYGEEGLGDWRPPQIFEYDPLAMTVTDRTPIGMLDPDNATLGIRSAGALDGVILMAGQSLDKQRINIFAFLDDGTYLGMHVMEDYNDIRHKWVVYNGIMYVGVKTTKGDEGRVLRWTGDSGDPFQFEVVGKLDLQAANMTVHRNRLFVTTWPGFTDASGFITNPALVGLWKSPNIPAGGLTGADNDTWYKVWEVSDYEPDPVMQRAYAGGALASLDGTLFWGTMHVPFMGTAAALVAAQYNPDIDYSGVDGVFGPNDVTALALGTHRATSVFSSTFETAESEVELLYGDEYLPVYNPAVRSYTIAEDDMYRNNMGTSGKFGPSGICSYFNAYTWTMERGFLDYPNRGGLLLGTFDSSFVLRDMAGSMLAALIPDCVDCGDSVLNIFLGVLDEMYNNCGGGYGADLYVIRSADEPFILDSKDGAGNYLNYGIRTMQMPDESGRPVVPDGPDFMGEETCPQGYLGMANPFNLADEGGWELIQIHPMPEIVVVSPIPDQFVIGDLMLQAQDISICPLVSAEFVITNVADQSTVHGPATNAGGGLWEYPIDVQGLPNGVYYAVARGSDADGGEAESDPVAFVVANECSEDSDCDDGLFCTGNETCVESMCQPGTDPCPAQGKICYEDPPGADEPGCFVCEYNPDCQGGFECEGLANVCDICELNAGHGKKQQPVIAHPTKDKKAKLYITGLEDVDITGDFDLGPFGFKKAKVKFNKGVLKVKITVPAGLASGDYEIEVGGCRGIVTVVNKDELKAWKVANK